MINKASTWLAAHARGEAFGGESAKALSAEERRRVAARLMPAIRKRISLQLAHDLAQALQGRFGFAPSAQDHARP